MVIAWQLFDKSGGLITTCFKERDAIRAKERLESRGDFVRMEKIFDAHLKERQPVVRQVRKKEPVVSEHELDGYFPVTIYLQPGDIIVSELGMAFLRRGKVEDGVTRAITNTSGKLVPVLTRYVNGN